MAETLRNASRIAMVVALEREVCPLVKGWRASEREHAGWRFRFFEKDDVVVVCGGIGAEAARRAAEAVIVHYAPEVVYSVGFAGALEAKLKVGDWLRPGRVVNAGDGSSVAIEGGEGVLVSLDAIASPEQKAKLREAYEAQAVDMEAAAVARAAEARGVAFVAVKAISDEVDFVFPPMERFVDSAGRFSEARFAVYTAVRPWLWWKVIRMGQKSRRAAASLCEHLRKEFLLGAVENSRVSQNRREVGHPRP
jgi:adenosylhomocysteine nucleosidase